MTEDSNADLAFARVIAALDVSCQDGQTLAMAAEVAGRLGVDVAGLFIEDVNLFRAAALPVARHVAAGPSAATSLNVEQLTTEMRALAALAESELRNSAARYGIKSSFRVVRGFPAAELSLEASTEDLLIVGAARALADLPLSLNSSLRDAMYRVGCSILQARQSTAARRPLLVLRAGSALNGRALAAAMRFVETHGAWLEGLLVGASSEIVRAEEAIEAIVGRRGRHIRLRHAMGVTPAQIVRAAREGGNDMLIVVSDLPGLSNATELGRLIADAPCGVLIVR